MRAFCRLSTIAFLCCVLGCSSSDDSGSAALNGDASGTGQASQQGGSGSFTVSDQVAVQVSPASLFFVQGELNVSQTKLISVSHTGSSGTLLLRNIVFDANSDDLSIELPASDDGMVSLGTSQTKSIRVIWTPTDALADSATLSFETNAAAPQGGTVQVVVDIQTPAFSVDIIADTSEVDLSGTPSHTTATAEVNFRNIGNLPAEVTSLSLADASSLEFSLEVLDELPITLEQGTALGALVHYTPEGQDIDDETLTLMYTSLDGGGQLTVPVRGSEISARLQAVPNPIDFGAVLPSNPKTTTVSIKNLSGEVPLVIESMAITEVLETMVTVDIVNPEGDASNDQVEPVSLTVEPGGAITLELSIVVKPGVLLPPTPLAMLELKSNDPLGDGVATIPIHAQRLGSGLEVHPPDIVYFGYVGDGGIVERVVTLYNAGNDDVTIIDLDMEGDYSIVDPDAWGPSRASAIPAVIEPFGRREVVLRFVNVGGLETAWGKLIITSDDGVKPYWEVLLNAQKVEGADCLVQFVPGLIEFGLTAAGSVHERMVKLVNIGGEACLYHSAIVDDCEGIGVCTVSADDAMAPGSSEHFTVVSEPESQAVIAPGEHLMLSLGFTAPSTGDWIQSFPAMLRARVTDLDETVTTVHPSAASWLTVPNVSAEVGIGQLVVSPGEVDFKQVTIGCATDAVSVVGTNVGLAPLQITAWSLVDCSDAVEVIAGPDVGEPLTVGINETTSWAVRYVPSVEVDEACHLSIESTDRTEPTIVSLAAQARYETSVVDVFTDSESQVVDVLFVVDNSGSMSQEQSNLAQSFEAFIVEASNWNSDYQIGVTTTTVDIFDLSGGVLQGSPPWVSALNWEKFVNIVEVGTSGSGIEQGLYSALIALSSPITDAPAEACVEDTDCGLYRACVLERCQGLNYGFLRPEAALEVVFVSDEEDQSPDEVENYLDFFRSLKGYDRPDLLHLHAIVGPPGGCSSANGSADPGLRYRNMANATGGAVYSICELDFAKGLEGIGEIAFSAQMAYPLSQLPAPPTITVTIEGLPCPASTSGVFNWVYDPDDNVVTLTEEGICKARPGELVEIAYELLCFEAAD